MKAIADFLQRVLSEPASSFSHTESDAKKKKKKQPPPPPPLPSRQFEVGTLTEVVAIPSTSLGPAALYETPKPMSTIGEISDDYYDNDDGDDDFVKGDTRSFGREKVGPIASTYILPYLSKRQRRHLETRYGIRKDGDSFKMGESTVLVDTDSDITIKGKEFRGTTGFWELLKRKTVDRRKITTDDLKKYKTKII